MAIPRSKRFDFSDIEDQLCYYNRVGKCNNEAAIVIIRMETSIPAFVCLDCGIKYLNYVQSLASKVVKEK